nr:hypothetical protein [Tanacetum cinerariifolium]
VGDELAKRDATRSRNGEDNHDSRTGVKRQTPLARECTYSDFMKCKILYFKVTEEFVELTQCGLPDMIHESVMAFKPKTMQDAIEFATKLMDKKSALLLNVELRTRGNLITTTKLNNNLPRSKVTAARVESSYYCYKGTFVFLRLYLSVGSLCKFKGKWSGLILLVLGSSKVNSARASMINTAVCFQRSGGLVEDLVNYHLKELRYSAQCHTKMSMWINSRGDVRRILLVSGIEYLLVLHRSSVNNSASLSNKFRFFYFSIKDLV